MKVNSEYHTIGGEKIVETNENPDYKIYRQKWHQNPSNYIVEDFPLFLDIDITDICNLKCPFCLRISNPEVIKNEKMPFDMFKKIIDEGYVNGLFGIKLNIIGEPLIHDQVYEFVKYAKDKGLIDVYFNTNATLLTKEKGKKLIESGLDRLSISFEGSSKDIYEKNRVGANFEQVVRNIKNFQLLKKELNVTHPKVRIQTVLLPELEPIIEDYKRFWIEIVDEIGFLDYQPRVEKKNEILKGDWACPQLWQRMGILVDGTIIPCNHDEKGLSKLGNVENTPIKEAWHSDKLESLRELHKKGKAHKGPACKFCYLRYSEVEKLKKGGNLK